MTKIAFLSCFYNNCCFKRTIANCERFLKETVGTSFPVEDFYFCQVLSKFCPFINFSLSNNYLELQSESILWHKERCLNLLIKKFKLYEKYDYICWLDTDILFDKPIVLSEDFNYSVFQPFKTSLRQSDKDGRAVQRFESWAYNRSGDRGLGWGVRADLLRKVGGFFDYGIVGGGDSFFLERMQGKPISIKCSEFDKELATYFKDLYVYPKDIGYLDNTVTHLYHGTTANRNYDNRIKILQKHNFKPLDDLIVEKSGLYRLRDPIFESDVKHYFLAREEDS